ncbi:hypothetical protein CIRG_00802 [Coccidioides immitis RMSCC 2394]|uniref:Transcription factor Iwr1 domain-containing protein n=1 Tax=Coccidioides immitis RMSCC 2394 TaxID=404692 RepID=A0A0J6XZ26_COCIT|nr:hypothetical protein CIRG_00802 [Coccidioides immitis RMSCC 2394]
MALPPEQIRIKRRREEEPVETLYIQSQTRETKRRFTDFVFQRVVLNQDGVYVRDMSGHAGAQEAIKSTADSDSMRAAINGPSVPVVRTGEELRKVAEAAKQKASTRGMAVPVKPHARSTSMKLPPRPLPSTVTKSSVNSTVRKFHIAAPVADDLVLHKVGGGVQKKKGPRHAVVVEQKGDIVRGLSELAAQIGDIGSSTDIKAEDVKREVEMVDAQSPTISPRKRRVVNEAERRWKEKANAHRYTDRETYDRKGKTGTSIKDDPATWDYDSAQLAEELEHATLELAFGEPIKPAATPEQSKLYLPATKPVLKYRPRVPKQQQNKRDGRGHGLGQFDGVDESGETSLTINEPSTFGIGLEDISSMKNALEEHVIRAKNEKDDESDYVYDIFIRRSLQELADDPKFAQFQNGDWYVGYENVPADIGVVVISDKDVHYWDAVAEDDEEDKDWNTEDEDSNAEDNPANEYPDEDLDLEDEFDDVNAAYNKYRNYGSDYEQFDINDEVNEYGFKPTSYTSSGEASSDDEERLAWRE